MTASHASSGSPDVERQVAGHYSNSDLERAILDALIASGKDVMRLEPADLAPVDEFHTAGRRATIELAEQLDFRPDMHLLDIGCGIGGASRYFAEARGCRVTGIDLTDDYVRTAASLSRRVGLASKVTYRTASALALPFEAGSFDGAYLLHVGMNIQDKPRLFAEARRVLKRGATFAIFDVMRTGAGSLRFPLHWAATPQTSFVAGPAEYGAGLDAAGFDVVRERNRREFARQFFRELAERTARDGVPPLGIHLLMKTEVAQKLDNYVSNLEAGLIAPVELICRAR
jgi:ubiquinone/menaquinone biosynthesis C-methylase UbiE